jgi:hypothetical protein
MLSCELLLQWWGLQVELLKNSLLCFFSNRLDSLTFQLHPRLSGFFHQIVILFLGNGKGPTGAGKVYFPLIKVIRKVRKTQHQGYNLKYIRKRGWGGAGET